MDMRGIRDLLAAHPFFADLDENDVDFIAGCGGNVWFGSGETIFEEGSQANTLYVIRQGKVAIETQVPGRPGIVIDTVGPGDVVGWSWLFPPHRWHFDARVVEETGAIALDGACLRAKLDEDTALGYLLMQRFARMAGERMQATRLRLLDLYGPPGEPGRAG